ncbi:MAG TPA: malic enzyme-like NAD(P)-binding protein, partial [Clostridia bacterium]|nr:malic enzyme-like NAD(P)-binding protein [Clostridia bacterium]
MENQQIISKPGTIKNGALTGHNFTLQLTYPHQSGMFERIARAIGEHGGDLSNVNMVRPSARLMKGGLSIRARSEAHVAEIVSAVRQLRQVQVVEVSDPVFQIHQGGKIAVKTKVPLLTRETLAMVYTPGVARVSSAIAADRTKAWTLTAKSNSVAVVSDGTAVLGLGDIGPEAALPVMEGKAMLFKEFAQIDAYPICLQTTEVQAVVDTVANLSVGFGGINLEDISAPRCFDIEEKLQARLNIPVFHDDQHGTAVVVLAALLNALRLTGRKLPSVKVVISGAGAAGTAIAKMLLRSGVKDIVVCDRGGVIHKARPDLNKSKRWLARHTNPRRLTGTLAEALHGAHVLIGVSGPGLIDAAALRRMAPRAIVFALAN